MHMADALLSPVVGGTMWAASAVTIACCSRKVRSGLDDRKIPLMGVLGAFIFAAQMINFTIPVTGSSGHIGGGLMLSILLGPYAAFLTIASVLVVQALFFADGGLLALGCNIFNLGFFPAFIAYPLVYNTIAGRAPSPAKVSLASVAAAVVGLQLGAFGVVVETVLSGISALPFYTFAAIMQPIHLAIGMVEGVVTASVITFVYRARPEILQSDLAASSMDRHAIRNVALSFLVIALLSGGVLTRFASERPDGLEWSITKVTGQKELKSPEDGIHKTLATIPQNISYWFSKMTDGKQSEAILATSASGDQQIGTSVSGMIGGVLTLAVSFLIGYALKRRVSKV